MAAQSNTGTATSSLNKYWLKVQGKLAKSFAHGKRKEKKFFDSLAQAPEPWSAYEVTFPLDLKERGGVAAITDFGYKAKASSVNAVEATVSAVHYQARFAIADIAQYADRGAENQQQRQLVVQGMQKVDAVVEHFSDYFHGSSSALLATTDSDISGTTATLTLTAGYGVAGITNAKFIASMFKVGERVVALDSSNALIDSTDSFGEITAVSKANGTIGVTFDGSITYSTNGIRLYKANNLEGTTAAGGSDLNKGLVGLIDITSATSVHNVSKSVETNWDVAYSDTNAGRFTHSKMRRGKDEIENESGLTPDTLFMAQGVYRDMIAQERAGLRYDDASGLSFDGDVKAKGMTIITSKNTPPGYVYLFAKAGMNKWEILPTTERPSWGDLQESETLAGKFGRIDWFGNNVVRNRKAFAYWTSQTEA